MRGDNEIHAPERSSVKHCYAYHDERAPAHNLESASERRGNPTLHVVLGIILRASPMAVGWAQCNRGRRPLTSVLKTGPATSRNSWEVSVSISVQSVPESSNGRAPMWMASETITIAVARSTAKSGSTVRSNNSTVRVTAA